MATQKLLATSSKHHTSAPTCLDVTLKYIKQKQNIWHVKQRLLLVLFPVLTAAIILLLHTRDGAGGRTAAVSFPQTEHYSMLQGPRTNAPMAVLPPYEPTCFVIHEERVKVQCPVIDCSLDSSCTTSNKSCCAFVNLQIMLFFDQFLASKGFEGQYSLVYGSVIGAVRNQTVLPHTGDVDFGISPRVAQFLEQNSTRREIWSYGYSIWADKTVWRMCPHQHHPSPDLQRLMQPLTAMNHYQQAKLTGAYAGAAWLDGFLIWPVNSAATNCTVSDPNLDVEALLSTSPQQPGVARQSPEQAMLAGSAADGASNTGADGQHFCIHHGAVPVLLKPGSRPATVAGHRLPAPEDMERHVEATYGPHWRTPDLQYHGADPDTPDVDRIRAALHQKMSVTTWGDTPLAVRKQRCARGKRG